MAVTNASYDSFKFIQEINMLIERKSIKIITLLLIVTVLICSTVFLVNNFVPFTAGQPSMAFTMKQSKETEAFRQEYSVDIQKLSSDFDVPIPKSAWTEYGGTTTKWRNEIKLNKNKTNLSILFQNSDFSFDFNSYVSNGRYYNDMNMLSLINIYNTKEKTQKDKDCFSFESIEGTFKLCFFKKNDSLKLDTIGIITVYPK